MRTTILLILAVIFLGGCRQITPEQENEFKARDFEIVTVDSCEYIRCMVYGGYSFAHKGNCKFCKQRSN